MLSIVETLATLMLRVRLVAFDFDGVFTDNTVLVAEDGTESVRCWRSDGLGLRKLERLGLGAVIISTEPNPVVAARARKMRVRCLYGVDDKLVALESLARDLNLSLTEVAFLGNDVNDLSCLQRVGLPAAVQDAHPDILGAVRHRTRAPGGRGAVREFCDLFEMVYGKRSL